MGKKIIFAVVIAIFLGSSVVHGLSSENEKMGVLQKIKNAYNDLRNRQQQKSPVPALAPAKVAAPKIESPKDKEMTKDQILAELKRDLADNDELLNVVPGLKASVSKDGSIVYAYNSVALDELSREDLSGLYSRVSRSLVKIRTDRIRGQLETVRQAERLRGAVNPPQPSRIPAAPPSVPRTPPSPPPAPPRR
jgi:hypothetical protein